MNIYKYATRVAFLLIAMMMSVTITMAQSGGNGYGGFDPSNPGNPGSNGWNAATGEVIIDDFTTGNLNSAIKTVIGYSGASAVTQIMVSGSINSGDFTVAHSYSNCTLIDFSRAAGLDYVPSSAYSGNATLCSILLPTSITSIQSSAFKNCTSLTSLTSYTLTPPTVASDAFEGVNESLVVYVPADAVDAYMNADVWKNFTILPIQSSVHSVTIGMPEGTDMSIYKNMNLQLVNAKSGQKYKYILTDKMSYRFGNLVENTVYNAYILNEKDSIFGKIENITLNTKDVTATFATLAKPQQVSLSIVTPEGKDVTSEATVTWTDANGNYIGQAYSITGQKAGTQLKYRVVLPEALAVKYASLNATDYTVAEGNNTIICKLDAIQKIKLSGNVKDAATNLAISSAVVTASQTFGGKYTRTVSAKTDIKGNYTLEISSVPTSLAIAATDYTTQTIPSDSLNIGTTDITVPDVKLKSINGAVINLGFTYTESKAEGKEAEVQNWYDDYNNVDYSIYDKTSQKNISQFSVQYPKIVLLEDVAEGDVLELTASSRKSAFTPVTTSVTINAEQNVDVTFNVVELGGIKSSFENNVNATVVGILYNADGKMLKNSQYSDGTLEFSDLADGSYTLVTMGSSTLFNNVYDLSQFEAAGLSAGTDYVQNNIAVKSGEIISLSIAEVPVFNDSKLHYTGDNTSFTVNKSSIVAGNYLTLTGHIDFKSEYASEVSDVNLVVDLPESCSFVENSVMVGSSTGSYSVDGSRITIPIANYSDRVRFCIIPTESGEYAPSALVQFNVGGNAISQPIGSANYTAKNLSISVPKIISDSIFTVSGTAQGSADIQIFAWNSLIGQTKSIANGLWSTQCVLNRPYNLSTYDIFAKITNQSGISLVSETKQCKYNKDAIEVSTVTMINTAHTAANLDLYNYVRVFDFQNPALSMEPYWYWPKYPDFTFLVNFTRNDTTVVSNVKVHVLTSANTVVSLKADFDDTKKCWLAKAPFDSSNLPTNLDVSFDSYIEPEFDERIIEDFNNNLKNIVDETKQEGDSIQSLTDQLIKEYKKSNPDMNVINGLNNTITYICNYTPEQQEEINKDADEIFKKWQEEHPTDYDSDSPELNSEFKDFVTTELQNRCPQFSDNEKGIAQFVGDLNNGQSITASGTYHVSATDGHPEITYIRNDGETVYDISELYKNNGRWNINESETDDTKLVMQNPDTGEKLIVSYPVQAPADFSNETEVNNSYNLLEKLFLTYGDERNFVTDLISDVLDAKCIEPWDENVAMARALVSKYKSPGMNAELEGIAKNYSRLSTTAKVVKGVFAAVSYATDVWSISKDRTEKLSNDEAWGTIMDAITAHCDKNAAKSIIKVAKKYKGMYDWRSWAKSVTNGALAVGGVASACATGISFGTSLFITCGCFAASKKLDNWKENFTADDTKRKGEIRKLVNQNSSCTPINDDDMWAFLFPPIDHIMDPSGYVYEGVSTNRVQGVTATAYYKEEVEDMYGDKHENIVKWDAAEYAQENPLFTDEDGMYAWDVPDGLWQVKFEKEGYETTYSDWLPVPPPQLDINIPMTQNTQPEVKTARAFDDAVTVEFDKYMLPDLLTTDNITVKADGKAVEGTVALLNEEVKCEGATDKYASKVRFNAAKPFSASEVTLTVSRNVKSYAGITMENDFSQTFTVEHEVQSIECDSAVTVDYGGSKAVTVSVLPISASAGKTLRVKNSSSMILSASATDVVLDAEGKAAITVSGELPGTAALTYTVEGYDISASQIVKVEDKANETVAVPVASIASGSAVAKGTEVTLTTTEKNAKIYYTLDGSCPCENASRILYEKPIVIDADVTIKAMAIASDGVESDVVTFVYTIDKESGIKEVTSDQHVNLGNISAIYNLNGVKLFISDISKLEKGIYIILTEMNDKKRYVKYVKNR